MTTEPHSWERRQNEKERAAALETVGRLELALIELEAELDYRRVELGTIIASRHERGAQVLAAYAAGARVRFGGSDAANEAEPSWDGAPHGAVRTLQASLDDAPRLAAEETRALGAVADLERRVLQAQRLVAHWRAEAGNGSPSSGSPSSDSPTMLRAPVGPPESGAAEPAEAAAVAVADHGPPTATPPAAPFSARLAQLGRRVAGW